MSEPSRQERPASPAQLRRRQERLLEQIARAAQNCAELERQFGEHPAPELETLLKLYRALVLSLSLEAREAGAKLNLFKDLLKPLLDWAALQEKQKQRELLERKYRDQQEAQRSGGVQQDKGGVQPQTLRTIQEELSLL